ncbi:MAG TPA: ATP-grasp domain-containing protein [Acidimicrobiia bacterium]|nr:ATP-grasp domain-containing protein [Acidimicrobiia bacterium]
MTAPAVVFGGPSDEHDISILTGLQISHALKDVLVFYWSKGGDWFQVDPESEAADFVDGPPRKAKAVNLIPQVGQGFVGKKPIPVSAVVNACHGGPGEDGTLQGIFDLAGIRYTGPGQAASALGMDKFAFGAAMAATGLPTLPRALLASSDQEPPGFAGPYIVKPRFGGSSIGIEVVEDWPTAIALLKSSPYFQSGGVVEPFVEASRDLQMAIRTWPVLEMSAIEAPLRTGGRIYSYNQKYLAWGGEVSSGRELPAKIDPATDKVLRDLARRVVVAAGLRGICRIDFLERDSEVWVNEVNTIPGSMGAYLWIDPPISRPALFGAMLDEALESPVRRFSVKGADGTALRNAGTISNKLG